MGIYHYLGQQANILGYRELQRLGQSIELPDDLARELIIGGGRAQGWAGATQLLPKAEFDQIGFTPAELKYFALPASWNSDVQIGRTEVLSVADFLKKKQSALMALHEYRERIETPDPSPALARVDPTIETQPEEVTHV